jgi:hypothetical protein
MIAGLGHHRMNECSRFEQMNSTRLSACLVTRNKVNLAIKHNRDYDKIMRVQANNVMYFYPPPHDLVKL